MACYLVSVNLFHWTWRLSISKFEFLRKGNVEEDGVDNLRILLEFFFFLMEFSGGKSNLSLEWIVQVVHCFRTFARQNFIIEENADYSNDNLSLLTKFVLDGLGKRLLGRGDPWAVLMGQHAIQLVGRLSLRSQFFPVLNISWLSSLLYLSFFMEFVSFLLELIHD